MAAIWWCRAACLTRLVDLMKRLKRARTPKSVCEHSATEQRFVAINNCMPCIWATQMTWGIFSVASVGMVKATFKPGSKSPHPRFQPWYCFMHWVSLWRYCCRSSRVIGVDCWCIRLLLWRSVLPEPLSGSVVWRPIFSPVCFFLGGIWLPGLFLSSMFFGWRFTRSESKPNNYILNNELEIIDAILNGFCRAISTLTNKPIFPNISHPYY